MSIEIKNLTKQYGAQVAVYNVSLEIAEGEFFVLLGPSGSGKTTVLNIIAGLVDAEQGQVFLNDRDVTILPPQKRSIGFVFQNYGLFQYMSVEKNIEFGLTVRKVPPKVRKQRCEELLELVGLVGLGNRLPKQLSGGQQQRVALARALAPAPEVLLLDEPLGALDAKIRFELRRNLHAIQRELGVTTILVTHDQEEAFDLADRIGVMNFGRLVEVGTPEDLYKKPKTEFVASFLGTANLLVGNVKGKGVQVGDIFFPQELPIQENDSDHRVQVLFRPEDVSLAITPEKLNCPPIGQGIVIEKGFAGPIERLRLKLPGIKKVRPLAPPVSFGQQSIRIDVTRPLDDTRAITLEKGDSVWIGVRHLHVLPHLGLRFLLAADMLPVPGAVVELGSQIARLSNAQLTVLVEEDNADKDSASMQELRRKLGSGFAALEIKKYKNSLLEAIEKETKENFYDLIIHGLSNFKDLELVNHVLQTNNQHLLLIPCAQPVPLHALLCVIGGEPTKEDIFFSGRFLRHLGTKVTMLCALESNASEFRHNQAQRFLANGERSLGLFGVPVTSVLREGSPHKIILDAISQPEYDLVVLGVPLPKLGKPVSLQGVTGNILEHKQNKAFLIIRSRYAQQDPIS